MERVYSSELAKYVGSRVRVAGWIHRVRRLSRVSFLILRDARGLAQIVLDESTEGDPTGGLHGESVVAVEGLVVANPQAPLGVEIRDPVVEVISAATAAPPIDLFRPILNSQLPTLLDHAALTLRHPRRRALWQIAAASLSGFRSALGAIDFVEIHTP